MKVLSLAVLLFLAAAPVQQSNIKLEIGAKLDKKEVRKKADADLMTHPAQFRPYIERTIDGVDYIIAFEEKSREIRYIYTSDPDFKPAGGPKVGDFIEISPGQMEVYPGWEIRAPETSGGWHPLIGFNDEITSVPALWGKLKVSDMKEGDKVRAKILAFVKGGR